MWGACPKVQGSLQVRVLRSGGGGGRAGRAWLGCRVREAPLARCGPPRSHAPTAAKLSPHPSLSTPLPRLPARRARPGRGAARRRRSHSPPPRLWRRTGRRRRRRRRRQARAVRAQERRTGPHGSGGLLLNFAAGPFSVLLCKSCFATVVLPCPVQLSPPCPLRFWPTPRRPLHSAAPRSAFRTAQQAHMYTLPLPSSAVFLLGCPARRLVLWAGGGAAARRRHHRRRAALPIAALPLPRRRSASQPKGAGRAVRRRGGAGGAGGAATR
jgi:hypothetical protein